MSLGAVHDETCGGLLAAVPEREDALALTGMGGAWALSRRDLRSRVAALAAELGPPGALVMVGCRNDPATIVNLLASFAAGHAAMLIEAKMAPGAIANLVATYRPDFILGDAPAIGELYEEIRGGFRRLDTPETNPVHPELGLLLSTSGTTGNSKFVRLSRAAIAINARQIATALGMSSDDVGVAHLPLSYSYGLSVVTSHLIIGATVQLIDQSVTTPDFWNELGRAGATQFPGVPFHYNFLARADLARSAPRTLRCFTQAGGRLDDRIRNRLLGEIEKIDGRFYTMYGQTEAAPRMTTLPASQARAKPGSVGRALDGGRVVIEDEARVPVPSGQVGAVVYYGPNVMLGYAQSRQDLATGDTCQGRLLTGDIGYLDADDYLFLTGRANRFAKVHGLRIDLDDIERQLATDSDVVAIELGDRIAVYCREPESVVAPLARLVTRLSLHPSSFEIKAIAAIPYLASGKRDYAALRGQ